MYTRKIPYRHPTDERMNEDYEPPNPGRPVDCRPGTPEKLAALIARYENGEPLHHDDDCSGIVHPHLAASVSAAGVGGATRRGKAVGTR